MILLSPLEMNTWLKRAAILSVILFVVLVPSKANLSEDYEESSETFHEETPSHRIVKRSLLHVILGANITDIPDIVEQAPLHLILPTMALLNDTMRMRIMGALSGDQILLISHKMNQDQRGLLLSYLPPEGVVSLSHTLTQDQLGELLSLLSAESIVNLTHALMSAQLGELLVALSPESIVNLTKALSKDQNMEIIQKLTHDDLLKLIQSLNKTQSAQVLDHLPPSGVANLTTTLSDTQLTQLINSLPPRAVGDLVLSFSTDSVQGLLERLSQDSIQNLTTSLSVEQLANLTQRLPPNTVVNLTSMLPGETVAAVVSSVPPATLSDLITEASASELKRILFALSPAQMSGIISTLPGEALSFLLNTLPADIVVNLTLSLQDDALARVLGILPPENVSSLIIAFPQEAVNNLVPKIPLPLLFNLSKALPPQFIFSLSLQTILGVLLQIPSSGLSLTYVIDQLVPGGLDFLITAVFELVDPSTVQELLKTIPSDKITGLLHSLLPDLLQSLAKDQNFQNSLGQILTPEVVSSLGGLLTSMPPEKVGTLARSILPSLLGSNLKIGSLLTALPLTDMLGMAGQLIPEIPKTLAQILGDVSQNMSLPSGTSGLYQCALDLQLFLLGLSRAEDWAVQMFDAFGKPGRGLLKGNTHMLGNFEQCLDIGYLANNDSGKTRLIKGNYCGVQINTPPGILPETPGKGILPDPTVTFYGCLPDSCHDTDIKQLLSTVSLPLNITIPDFWCSHEPNLSTSDPAAVVVICVLAAIFCLVVIGTAVDVIRRRQLDSDEVRHFTEELNMAYEMNETSRAVQIISKKEEETTTLSNGLYVNTMPVEGDEDSEDETEGSRLTRALLAFSLPRNAQAIFKTDGNPDDVMSLHGIRVLSVYWVLVGHTFYYMALFFENPLKAAEALQTVLGQVVINSTLAVDSLFVVSGCLLAYVFLTAVRREEGLTAKKLVQYYIHRYLRITPTYGIVILFCTCLLPYLSGGPDWWRQSKDQYSSCRSYWWTNIIYVNNFYRSEKDQCLDWSWYLSADMQMYWLAPILLVPFAAGFRVAPGLLICGLVIMQSALTAYFQQNVNGDFLRNHDDFSWTVFQKTYCRVAPYVLGIGVGYVLTRVKGFYKMSSVAVSIGWFCTLALTSTTTFIKYDENHVMLDTPFYWSEESRAVHEALFRTGFSLAVCWIIFACATGNGGFVNSILSWRGFVPLSRLSFCVYLIHPVIILADQWTSRVAVYFTISYVFQRSFGYLFMSLVFGFILSAAVERPVSVLERLTYRRPGA